MDDQIDGFFGKTRQIQNAMNSVSQHLSGSDKTVGEHIQQATCSMCGQPATKFTDEVSLREFRISGMCQSCQDSVFD